MPVVGRATAIGLALAAVVAGCRMEAGERAEAVAREAESGLRGLVVPGSLERPDFTLTDMHGDEFDFQAETAGRLALLFFGYTNCPDVCPIHMSGIAQVLRDLGGDVARRTRVVFVTVDPGRDTPERLQEWLGAFDPSFVGLRGDPARVNEIQLALGLPPAVAPDTSARDYDVGHASPVLAFATDGRLVRYPHGTRQEDWRHDLPILAGSE